MDKERIEEVYVRHKSDIDDCFKKAKLVYVSKFAEDILDTYSESNIPLIEDSIDAIVLLLEKGLTSVFKGDIVVKRSPSEILIICDGTKVCKFGIKAEEVTPHDVIKILDEVKQDILKKLKIDE